MESETKEAKSIDQKLFELQNEIGKITKDKSNPFYNSKYFDISGLISVLKPLLEKHKLLLKQPILENKVYTIIKDVETGEEEKSYLDLSETNAQKIGSEITFYRRYTLKALLAIEEEDDDGNGAKPNNNKINSKQEITYWLSDDQFKKTLNCGNANQIQKVLDIYSKPPKGMKKAFRLQLTDEVNRLNK